VGDGGWHRFLTFVRPRCVPSPSRILHEAQPVANASVCSRSPSADALRAYHRFPVSREQKGKDSTVRRALSRETNLADPPCRAHRGSPAPCPAPRAAKTIPIAAARGSVQPVLSAGPSTYSPGVALRPRAVLGPADKTLTVRPAGSVRIHFSSSASSSSLPSAAACFASTVLSRTVALDSAV
jgi:hypothetical protein